MGPASTYSGTILANAFATFSQLNLFDDKTPAIFRSAVFLWFQGEGHDSSCKLVRCVRKHHILAMGYGKSLSSDRCRHYSHSHGHGFVRFYPGATANPERNDVESVTADKGAYVFHSTRNGDLGVCLELLNQTLARVSSDHGELHCRYDPFYFS